MDKNKEFLICRTCLAKTNPTKCKILTKKSLYDGKLILKVLNFCIPELLINWKVESPAICMECLERLNILYNFKNMCIKNDSIYHKKYLTKTDLNDCPQSVPSTHDDITSSDITESEVLQSNVQNDVNTGLNQNESSISKATTNHNRAEKGVKRKLFTYKKRFTNKDCFGCQNHIRDGKYHWSSRPQAKNAYVCFNCGKHVETIGDMRKHIYTHLYLHKCKICNKKWKNLYQLDQHLRTHTKQKPFQCPECGKKYAQSFNLHQHLAIHNKGDKGNRNRCILCGKILSTKYNLKIHLTTHNIGCRPRCPNCDKWFYTEAALVKHSKKCVIIKEEDAIFISELEFIKTEVPEYVEREVPVYVKPEVPENVKEESQSDDDVFLEETPSEISVKHVFNNVQEKKFVTKEVLSFL